MNSVLAIIKALPLWPTVLVYSHCDPATETLNPTPPLSAGFVPGTAKREETLGVNMKTGKRDREFLLPVPVLMANMHPGQRTL